MSKLHTALVKIIKNAYRSLIVGLDLLIFTYVVIVICIQFSYVQTRMARYFAGILSQETKTEIRLDKVRINFFNSILIENLYVSDQKGDTLLFTQELEVGFELSKLLELKLNVNSLCLASPHFNLEKEKEDGPLNIQFLVDYFSSEDSLTEDPNINLKISHLEIIDGRFVVNKVFEDKKQEGFDFNHLDIKALNFYANEVNIDSNKVDIQYFKLSLQEKNFVIEDLSAGLRLSEQLIELDGFSLNTTSSSIHGYLSFKTNNWSDYKEFISNVDIKARFLPSDLGMNDLAYFAPGLKGAKDIPKFSGTLTGSVDNLKGRDVSISLANLSRADLSFSLRGLPNIEETFFFLNIKELVSSKKGIERIQIPPFSEDKFIVLPENMAKLGQIAFKGKISGFINNVVVQGAFNTNIGDVITDLTLRNEDAFYYAGDVRARSFDAGKFLGIESVMGKVTLSAKLKGKGLSKSDVEASIVGNIIQMELDKYNYHNVAVSGDFKKETFHGKIKINDPFVKLNFIGSLDLSEKEKQFNFMAEIEDLYPRIVLDMQHLDSSAHLSSTVNIDIAAKHVDSLIGKLSMMQTVYMDKKDTVEMKEFEFSSSREKDERSISVKSDAFDFDVTGRFDMLDGYLTFKHLVSDYFPNISKETIDIDKDFRFDLKVKDYSLIEKLVSPGIFFDEGSFAKGEFSSTEHHLDFMTGIYGFKYGKFSLDTGLLHLYSSDGKLELEGHLSYYSFGEGMHERFINITSTASENNIISHLNSYGSGPFSSDINLNTYVSGLKSYELSFSESTFNVEDEQWTLSDSNTIFIDSSHWEFSNLSISREDQSISLNGKVSSNPADRLELSLKRFDMSLFNPFLEASKIDLKGVIEGKAVVSNVYNDVLFESDLSFNNLEFNSRQLGSGHIKSVWDDLTKELEVDGEIGLKDADKLNISGKYVSLDNKSPLQINIKLNDLPLTVLEPFTTNILSDFEGIGSGIFQLTGKLDAPLLNGLLYIKDAGAKVDYTNVRYVFRNEDMGSTIPVRFTSDSIVLSDFIVVDEFKKSGFARVAFVHNQFKTFETDVKVTSNGLMLLNTTAKQNDLFYGQTYASGDVHISAKKGYSKISIDIVTDNNTRFNLPIDEASEITENQFIEFEQGEENVAVDEATTKEAEALNLELEIKLKATPGALARIVFDEVTGDVIETRGSGDLELKYSPKKGLTIFGTYEIQDGTYMFTLQSVVRKKFTIENGGTIRWTGDPYLGELNITTAYKLKTRLYDILPEVDPGFNYKKKVPVDLRLKMTESIFSPIINFSVFLPDSKESIKSQLRTELSNESCLNQQVFSLLILGSFTPCESKESSTVNTNVGKSTAYEAMSNQLSGWLSKISDDVDIGVSYRPEDQGEQYSSEQVEVALSTQLFNDRLILDGNVGYGNQTGTSQNTKDWAGEFTIQYKIRQDGRLRVKAFNKVNDRSYIENDNLYIQGIGLMYTRDFGSSKSRADRKKEKEELKKEDEILPEP